MHLLWETGRWNLRSNYNLKGGVVTTVGTLRYRKLLGKDKKKEKDF